MSKPVLALAQLLQLVQIRQNVDTSRKLGTIQTLLNTMLLADQQGADFFRGYKVSIAASTTPQLFAVDQFLLPAKLTGLTAVVPPDTGTLNEGDLFSLRVVDEDQKPDFLDLPISQVPLGVVDGDFEFRKGHPIPAMARLQVLWENAVANAKTLILAGSFIRDHAPQDQPTLKSP